MAMPNQKIELLAPAGSFESLTAAVQSGADAVYLGGKLFSARASAANFSNAEIEEAVAYCKKHNVKVYVTVNILIKNGELQEAAEFVSFLHEAGVDGVIIQDLGLWLLAEDLDGLERHVSTQMTLHNTPGVELLLQAGASQIVLSRELDLAEVSQIKEATGARLEVFGHGALCFSYSGQCLMSSMIGGRSGNRGRCAQPCRLSYKLVDGSGATYNTEGDYLLSTKDLRTALDLEKLTGVVDSLKLEGRLKRPEYVAAVTGTYRRLLDGEIDKDEAEAALRSVFNRDFTRGYLFGDRGKSIIGYDQPSSRGLEIGRVVSYTKGSLVIRLSQPLNRGDGIEIVQEGRESKSQGTVVGEIKLRGSKVLSAKPGDEVVIPFRGKAKRGDIVYKTKDREAEGEAKNLYKSERVLRKQPVAFFATAKVGSEFVIQVQNRDVIRGEAFSGHICERAENRPLDLETLRKQIDRLGNTPFSLEALEAELDGEAMVPFSVINDTRRSALEDLEEKIVQHARRKKIVLSVPEPPVLQEPQVGELIVEVGSFELFAKALAEKPDAIYLSGERYQGHGFTHSAYAKARELCRERGVKCYYVFPRIIHDRELKTEKERIASIDFDGYVVGNLGAFSLLKEGSRVVLDWGLNITNFLAFEFYKRYLSGLEIERCTLSLELKNTELRELARSVPAEVVVHGSVPVMVSENCIIGTALGTGVCRACRGFCREEGKQYYLEDRLGYRFPLVSDRAGRSHIFNSKDMCLIDEVETIRHYAAQRLMFLLPDEPVDRVIRAYRKALSGIPVDKADLESLSTRGFTYGHYFRGVE